MTLHQLSEEYRQSATKLRTRLQQLRQQCKQATDPEEIWQLQHRIAVLTPMLTEMNELAELTAHYYDRGYYRDETYTFQNLRGPSMDPRGAASAHSRGD